MRKLIYSIVLAAAGLTAVACGSGRCQKAKADDVEEAVKADEEIMGDWTPIVLSESTVKFPRQGGEAVVTCKNYAFWWIDDVQVVGEESVTHADPGENDTYRTLKADGISAEIINDNQVRIKVEESAPKRKWDLHLQSGDAFTTIRIEKKGNR